MAASRKLYVSIAKTIKYAVDGADPEALAVIDRLVKDIAYDLKQDNMAFDRQRFLDACGLS